MLGHQTGAALGIPARMPRLRLNQDIDLTVRRYRQQSKSEHPAELQDAGITLATSSLAERNGEPHFVARRHAIDGLQHQFKIETELELSDHDQRRLVAAQRDEIAAADFAFDMKA